MTENAREAAAAAYVTDTDGNDAGGRENSAARVMGQTAPNQARPEPEGPERFLAKVGVRPGQAFASKFAIHAGTSGRTLSGPEVRESYERLLAAFNPGPMAVYLHLPFCLNRCLYCGFAGQNPDKDLVDRYVSALEAEMEHYGTVFPAKPGPVRAVYFGGGTPTVLEPGQLARLTEAVARTFDLANDAEITLEGRVSDLSRDRADGFLRAGFNRFSLGVQSFSTEVRKSLGRHSRGHEAISFLNNLIRRQKAVVVIDLIYGLPGQSIPMFLADLETACQIGVDGLDTYQLNTFPGGALERAVEGGRLPAPAPLAGQADYYLAAAGFMADRKWRRLSLSHYARDTRERNIYNPWAKSRKDCLALGAGAGGFIDNHASYRLPEVRAYIEAAGKGLFAPDFLTLPSGGEALTGLIVSQLELGRLDLRSLPPFMGSDLSPVLLLAENWQEAGLLEQSGDCLELTEAGRFWGVNLTQAMVVTASEAMAKGQAV
jgi:oxygen-independent coproporphyrinogen-3 oxidase